MARKPERLLLHPAVLAALALWAINDHYLKGAWGHALTGKLSDVAGFIAAPVLLAALAAELGWTRFKTQRLLFVCSALVIVAMAAIKLWLPAAEAYRYGLAALQWPFRCTFARGVLPLAPVRLVMDPTDLWTAPAVLVPLWLCRAQRVEA